MICSHCSGSRLRTTTRSSPGLRGGGASGLVDTGTGSRFRVGTSVVEVDRSTQPSVASEKSEREKGRSMATSVWHGREATGNSWSGSPTNQPCREDQRIHSEKSLRYPLTKVGSCFIVFLAS